MYINVCVKQTFEKRYRQYTKIESLDASIERKKTTKGELWFMDNLTPCKEHMLDVKFDIFKIAPGSAEPEMLDIKGNTKIAVLTGEIM